MHDDELEMMEIKFNPREKLNHNIHCIRNE